MPNCKIHRKTKLVQFCPACRGGVVSKIKSKAARQNGKLGGRPRNKVARVKR